MLESSYDKAICFGVVEKLSGMGYKFHKRLLLLEDGVLSYYSKVPTNAEEGYLTLLAFKAMALKPKLSIQVKYIQSIKPADKALTDKKKKSSIFVVEFKKSAFTTSKKKDNEKGKNEQELEWIFSVNNAEDYEKWTDILNQAKASGTVNDLERSTTSPIMSKLSGRRQNVLNGSPNENSVMSDTSPVNVHAMIRSRQGAAKPSILVSSKTMENQQVGEDGELSPGKGVSPGKGDKMKKMKSVQWKEPGVLHTEMNEIKYEDRLHEIEEELRMKRRMEEERKRQEDEMREICIVEMIARAAKKVLRKEISGLVLEALEEAREEGNEGKDRSGLQGLTSKPVSIKDEDRRMSKAKALLKTNEIDKNIGDCVVEMLNFVFGNGKDSVKFWSEILSEQVLYDYNYDIGNLQKTEVALGGLLHAVIYHCDIKINIDEAIQEKLDKVPNPFPRACFEGIIPRSKVFSLHSLDVKSLSERYTQTREAKQYDAAIKSCLLAQSMEKLMAYKGESKENPVLLGEMGEIYFDKGHLDKAYELATEALSHSRISHVEALKSLCIIMKIHTLKGETEVALETLEYAIQRLNFHLGLYHPLYSTVYSMLGSYYAQTKNFQDALLLYKESLGRCKRELGPNHPITGQVYVDLGNLTLKMHQQEDALNYFEHAFCVFEASKSNESIECANMSYMMATLLMSFGKIKEAMAAVEHALKIYEKNEEDFVEKIAECCLLVCSIGESRNNDKLTLDHANKIWNILNKIPTKNEMHYKSRILTLTLTALIHGLTVDKKNFLYYIADSIVDVLGQENMLDKLYGGGEDTTLQKKYLEIIFRKCQASKNIRNLLREILKTLFQKLQEKDLKAFFRDYRKKLDVLDDLQLKECLNDFEMLIFIHGIQYFHDAFKKF